MSSEINGSKFKRKTQHFSTVQVNAIAFFSEVVLVNQKSLETTNFQPIRFLA